MFDLQALWDWLQPISPAIHVVALHLVPAPCVTGGDDDEDSDSGDGTTHVGFGAFVPVSLDGRPAIYVAGENPESDEIPANEWPSFVRQVFFHEYAHYEQYRDGLPYEEGYAESRAVELAGRYDAEYGRLG